MIVCLSALLLGVYLWSSLRMPTLFNSPDETANFFFAQRVANGQSLRAPTTVGQESAPLIHPRSTTVVDGNMVPGSFIGFPILIGIVGRAFGTVGMISVTPLAAALSIVVYYFLMREIIGERGAYFSAILVPLLPAFWYYASRPMYHNSLFVSLLVFGFYLMLQMIRRNSVWISVLASLFLSLALWVRTSEAPWVIAILVAVFLAFRHQYSVRSLVSFCLVGALAISALMISNNIIYGGPFSSAYIPAATSSGDGAEVATNTLTAFSRAFFPFGFHLAQAFWNFIRYSATLLPFFFILGCAGLGVAISGAWKRRVRRRTIFFGVLSGVVTAYLILYYGSWELHEYAKAEKVILASSYLRYWLPVLLFGVPFVSYGIIQILQLLPGLLLKRALTIFLSVVVVVTTMQLVYKDPLHGLIRIKQNLETSVVAQSTLLKHVEPNALIVSGYADKLFFPKRNVLVALPEYPSTSYSALKNSFLDIPVYYFEEQGDSSDVVSWNRMIFLRASASLSRFAAYESGVLYRVQL
ncbi:MAG: glycosyltransferase family 39 protein [bacterium]